MKRKWIAFLSDERGATAIEYGLIAALVAIIALVGIATAGSSVQALFGRTASKAGNAMDNAGG
jgi:pilus assembly protein Flp/PilA